MGFLDYLDDYEKNINTKVNEEKTTKRRKKPGTVQKETVEQKPKKKKYTIKKKRVITNPLVEARNHATEILDGMTDEVHVPENDSTLNMDNVADHASALL